VKPPLPQEGAKSRFRFCSAYGPHFCSMKITEDVPQPAAETKASPKKSAEEGMEDKPEFVEKGAEV